MSSSTLPSPISSMKLIFGTLLPSAASISSTTFLVTLALSLSPFSCGGNKNVLLLSHQDQIQA